MSENSTMDEVRSNVSKAIDEGFERLSRERADIESKVSLAKKEREQTWSNAEKDVRNAQVYARLVRADADKTDAELAKRLEALEAEEGQLARILDPKSDNDPVEPERVSILKKEADEQKEASAAKDEDESVSETKVADAEHQEEPVHKELRYNSTKWTWFVSSAVVGIFMVLYRFGDIFPERWPDVLNFLLSVVIAALLGKFISHWLIPVVYDKVANYRERKLDKRSADR